MSYRIYTAWRCAITDLNEVLDQWRHTIMTTKVIPGVGAMASGNTTAVFQELWPSLVEHANNPRIDAQDFTCSFNVFLREGKAYLIPIGNHHIFEELRHDKVTDYAYYNNSDSQLEHMTEAEWYGRRDVWEQLLNRTPYLNFPIWDPRHNSAFEMRYWVNDGYPAVSVGSSGPSSR